MDKIEKIRQEIERLIEMNKTKNGFPAGTICAVRIEAYEHLLSFIDTLSEEPDKSQEEAAKEYAEGPECTWVGTTALEVAFKAGAKWQKEQDDKELSDLLTIAHLQGAEQMKQQMLKDAVEGTVMDFSSNRPRPQVDVLLDPHKYHTGDKVRIIIVKEDGE